MADHAEDDNDGNIFIYRGGRAPLHVSHVLIDESVDEIVDGAFYRCARLEQVETHNGLRKVGEDAFNRCISLRHINLKSVVEIGKNAFCRCVSLRHVNLKSVVEIDLFAFISCKDLESVKFGDGLETIGNRAFCECSSLKHLKLPPIITIGVGAFGQCTNLSDIELSERLERIRRGAFHHCGRLQHIAIPLKRDLFEYDYYCRKYDQFNKCDQLTTVDIVGQAHTKTIASLHMESWRTEMIEEINRINQVLPNTSADEKANEIIRWMESLLDKMDHYKSEHYSYVKEGITLLELALWKAKLGEKEEYAAEGKRKKAKVDAESARKEGRITCGADMVIKNVLPFLQLE